MQKVNIKKLSLLGLVLMIASAITAAVLPNSKSVVKADKAGEITFSSADAQDANRTCKTAVEEEPNCNDTDSDFANSTTSDQLTTDDAETSNDAGGNGSTNTTLVD